LAILDNGIYIPVGNAFRNNIDQILSPVFNIKGDNRNEKRQSVIEKLPAFYEKYFDVA
jgi:hypothetical protein